MVMVLSELGIGAITTFLAILLWSKTRDTAWMYIILGTIIGYGGTVFSTLELFGIVESDRIVIGGVSIIPVILHNLPMVFFGIGFVVMVARKRTR